ncbi:MAG: hypothetical protein AB1633_09185, partial [Elusimicrobiota bacterium]
LKNKSWGQIAIMAVKNKDNKIRKFDSEEKALSLLEKNEINRPEIGIIESQERYLSLIIGAVNFNKFNKSRCGVAILLARYRNEKNDIVEVYSEKEALAILSINDNLDFIRSGAYKNILNSIDIDKCITLPYDDKVGFKKMSKTLLVKAENHDFFLEILNPDYNYSVEEFRQHQFNCRACHRGNLLPRPTEDKPEGKYYCETCANKFSVKDDIIIDLPIRNDIERMKHVEYWRCGAFNNKNDWKKEDKRVDNTVKKAQKDLDKYYKTKFDKKWIKNEPEDLNWYDMLRPYCNNPGRMRPMFAFRRGERIYGHHPEEIIFINGWIFVLSYCTSHFSICFDNLKLDLKYNPINFRDIIDTAFYEINILENLKIAEERFMKAYPDRSLFNTIMNYAKEFDEFQHISFYEVFAVNENQVKKWYRIFYESPPMIDYVKNSETWDLAHNFFEDYHKYDVYKKSYDYFEELLLIYWSSNIVMKNTGKDGCVEKLKEESLKKEIFEETGFNFRGQIK